MPSYITYLYIQGSKQWRELKTREIQWFRSKFLRNHNHIPLTRSSWPSFPPSLPPSTTPLCFLSSPLQCPFFSHKLPLSPLRPLALPFSLRPQLLVWLAVRVCSIKDCSIHFLYCGPVPDLRVGPQWPSWLCAPLPLKYYNHIPSQLPGRIRQWRWTWFINSKELKREQWALTYSFPYLQSLAQCLALSQC